MKFFKNKSRKVMFGIVIPLLSLLVIYLSMSIYFVNRFYFGTTINYMDISCKTVSNVDKYIETKLNKYTLILQEQNGIKEKIRGTDIELKYDAHNKIQNFKHNQSSFLWIRGLFSKTNFNLNESVSFDEELLKKQFNNLQCNNTSIITPKNPSFKYTNEGYKILEGSIGNKVKKDILYNQILSAIFKEKTIINLKLSNCYENPKYNSKSKEIINIKNKLNKYSSSKITYTFGNHTKILDGSIINTWLKVDKNLNIVFDEKKIRKYINTLANNYDTLGSTRTFVTSSGKVVKVSGGDYGWSINRNKEMQNLITSVKSGQIVTRQPIYKQTALSYEKNNDIGNTYVEIDLTRQYLWFYKNGSIIIKGNVVTGNVSKNHSTPTGIYKINYKQRNATLKGPGYASPVSYWMPFNGGIGIHDANWRDEFGGNIYLTNGSHGCVNAPYNVAKAIFYNINEGTPVICHF